MPCVSFGRKALSFCCHYFDIHRQRKALTLQGAGLHEGRKDNFGQGAGLHLHRNKSLGQDAALHLAPNWRI